MRALFNRVKALNEKAQFGMSRNEFFKSMAGKGMNSQQKEQAWQAQRQQKKGKEEPTTKKTTAGQNHGSDLINEMKSDHRAGDVSGSETEANAKNNYQQAVKKHGKAKIDKAIIQEYKKSDYDDKRLLRRMYRGSVAGLPKISEQEEHEAEMGPAEEGEYEDGGGDDVEYETYEAYESKLKGDIEYDTKNILGKYDLNTPENVKEFMDGWYNYLRKTDEQSESGLKRGTIEESVGEYLQQKGVDFYGG